MLIPTPATQGYQNFKDKSLLDEDEGEKFLQTEVILNLIMMIKMLKIVELIMNMSSGDR